MLDLLLLGLMTLRAAGRRRGELVLVHLLLRHQLAILARPTRQRRRVRCGRRDGLLWVLVRRVRRAWRRHLVVGTPDTVVRWHRAGWRQSRRRTSRAPAGRPRLSLEVQALSSRMAQENPLGGAERLRGELRTLGIVGSDRAIRRSRWRRPAGPPSQPWRTVLRTHADGIWAAALVTIRTVTCKTLYVLLLITHGRREPVHLAVPAHPAAAGVWRRLVEAPPRGRRPEPLLRDRDGVSGGAFRERAEALGSETGLTPVRAPRANAVAERVIGPLRRECPDHILPVDERPRRTVLAESGDSYHGDRPHRTLQPEPPRPQLRPRAGPIRSVRARPVLNGLPHVDGRAA